MEPFAPKRAGASRARTRFKVGVALVLALGASLQTFTLNASASFVADEHMSGGASDNASPFVGLCETYEAIPEHGHRFWSVFEYGVGTYDVVEAIDVGKCVHVRFGNPKNLATLKLRSTMVLLWQVSFK